LVATRLGSYPHTDDGVEVRRVFHKLRSIAMENFNEHFKSIFACAWTSSHKRIGCDATLGSLSIGVKTVQKSCVGSK
jgi:hypothetical protein